MRRTISVMVGKGSVNHNSRKFHAINTDPTRSHLNRTYFDDSIKNVYQELFGEAVRRYNEKQTRSDRMIDDYYKKICSGKQEKPFHEIILQIGNKNDMDARTSDGIRAAQILDEYMQMFQSRNPNMRVFSAHLHMDEATPHLHIDFVPFTTGSKRGLDTRVSLKQALAAQGFKGGSRTETEWNQWVSAEKKQLAAVMERSGIKWEQKGTHEKHLSVLDYEKKMRSKEVSQLEIKIEDLHTDIAEIQKSADQVHGKLENWKERERLVEVSVRQYDEAPEWQIPEPGKWMTANSYRTKIIKPFVNRLKDVIRSIVVQYLELKSAVNDLQNRLFRVSENNERLLERLKREQKENTRLGEMAKDYKRLRKVLGNDQTDRILTQIKTEEQLKKRSAHHRQYER